MRARFLSFGFKCFAAALIGLVIGCAVAVLSTPVEPVSEPLCTPGCVCDSTYKTLDCPDKLPPKAPK